MDHETQESWEKVKEALEQGKKEGLKITELQMKK